MSPETFRAVMSQNMSLYPVKQLLVYLFTDDSNFCPNVQDILFIYFYLLHLLQYSFHSLMKLLK